VVESFVIFIPFGAGDKTQFQIPARSQILTLVAMADFGKSLLRRKLLVNFITALWKIHRNLRQ
jgi:hypothetical protein